VDGDLGRPGSVGRPLDGTEVRILGQDGRALPPGATGEIIVAGPHVMAGYWRAPELTVSVFRRPGPGDRIWLHTGDFGHLDADGYLYFDGRRDQLFKRQGLRMSVTEIETAACDVPGVREAVVLAPTAERDMVLIVVADLAPIAVLRALAERLPSAKVPTRCVVLPELPRTANGKADRLALEAGLGR
jgi:acyl-coenzyme A synthetase/AMP-(fatty) acid ligase